MPRSFLAAHVLLDGLDLRRFAQVTRGGKVVHTLAGIWAAADVGLTPPKINVVAQRGLVRTLTAVLAFCVGGMKPRSITNSDGNTAMAAGKEARGRRFRRIWPIVLLCAGSASAPRSLSRSAGNWIRRLSFPLRGESPGHSSRLRLSYPPDQLLRTKPDRLAVTQRSATFR